MLEVIINEKDDVERVVENVDIHNMEVDQSIVEIYGKVVVELLKVDC